jgi:PAS domain S-box-containing protein
LPDKNNRIVFRVLLTVFITSVLLAALEWVIPRLIPGVALHPPIIAAAAGLFSLAAIAFLSSMRRINHHKTGRNEFPVNSASPKELAVADRSFHALFQDSPFAMVVMDHDANIRLWNPAAEKLFGWKLDEVIGSPLPIIPEDKKEEYRVMFLDALRGIERTFQDLQPQDKGGVRLGISSVLAPMRDESGGIDGAMMFFESISEDEAALSSLRKSEERLSLFMQNFPGIAFMQDAEGRYVYGNEAWFTQLPMKHSHLWRDRTGDNDWPPKRSLNSLDEERKVFREKKVLQTIETASLGNTDVSMLVLKFPISDKNGVPVLLGGVGINITEQKKFEEAARDYKEKLSSLAVAMSLAEETERRRIASELHDRIGQALALCKIKMDSLDSERNSDGTDKVLMEIGGLIDMSIQQIRSLTFQISPPLLYEVGLGVAVEWLGERFMDDYGLEVSVGHDLSPTSVPEEIRGTLFAIIRELLINVAKHADATRAEVTIGTVDKGIRIEVKDDGKGFDTAEIFGDARKGEGFGLFNIRQKTLYLNGEFYIDSVSGSGTKVTVITPVRRYAARSFP